MNVFYTLLLSLLALLGFQGCKSDSETVAMQKQIVKLEVVQKVYDAQQPWRINTKETSRNALVLSNQKLITTAEFLSDATVIRVQKEGKGTKFEAKISWISYPLNLALISVEDSSFWNGLRETSLSDDAPAIGASRIWRWQNGILESWHAEINQIQVQASELSPVNHVFANAFSEIPSAGWCEVVTQGSQVVGITTSSADKKLSVIPSRLLLDLLDHQKSDSKFEIGFFPFYWQTTENSQNAKRLNFPGTPKGVFITQVDPTCAEAKVFKNDDLILEINGMSIEANGDYDDPVFGFINLENLAVREGIAGSTIHFKIWRQGAEKNIQMTLPAFHYEHAKVPDFRFDEAPEYLIVGGLVFMPLTSEYLRAFGDQWRSAAPFRLFYHTLEPTLSEKEKIVILSGVLPDPYNLGYSEYRFLTVDSVNGEKIETLKGMEQALQKNKGEFHKITFLLGRSPRQAILDAKTLDEANQRILKKFSIPADRLILR
jgi:S1-C subfamily serine protease